MCLLHSLQEESEGRVCVCVRLKLDPKAQSNDGTGSTSKQLFGPSQAGQWESVLHLIEALLHCFRPGYVPPTMHLCRKPGSATSSQGASEFQAGRPASPRKRQQSAAR